MKISWRYFLSFLVLVILCVIALLNQSLVITYLIEPVTHIPWLIVRTLLVVDQEIYWTVLVFIVITFGLMMLPSRQENHSHTTYSIPLQLEDRVAYWEGLLRSAEDDANARLALQRSLNDINSSLDTFVEGSGRKQISLPKVNKGFWPKKLAKRGRSFLNFLPTNQSGHPESELEERIGQILKSMETIMEIQNDQPSSNPDDR